MSWNPFHSRRHPSNPDGSSRPGSLLDRTFSKRSSRKGEQSDSPLVNAAPPTRRPRAPSPPPAYTATTTPASGPTPVAEPSLGASPHYERYQSGAHPAISAAQASTNEDQYAFLSRFDTVFLIDDSGSMAGRSWHETQAAVSAILPIIFSHDEDGPDFYFMNNLTMDAGSSDEPWKAGTGYRNVKRSQGTSSSGEQLTVEEMFNMVRPRGATPTGQRLAHILRHYLKEYEARVRETGDETCLKPLSIIVITDGAPSDEVGGVIKQAAKRLDKLDAPPYQIGIQFFQVGNERGAAAALRELDDELNWDSNNRELRDMVDTATFSDNSTSLTGDGILKVVLGSVVKRLDKVDANLRQTSGR
ncbi:hypothetical protein SCAR479_11006 [Seiridium cardinale]|uniref:VWFA domain-containing protein n=1 Tax=Seiridium cardinale TaxID=138064 RepID=A0ABR2XEU1_9PEZI